MLTLLSKRGAHTDQAFQGTILNGQRVRTVTDTYHLVTLLGSGLPADFRPGQPASSR